MPEHVDLVIAGAGPAGLTLAARLATGPWGHRRVLVVDDHRLDPATRRWASWSRGDGPLDDAVTARWSRLRVVAAGRTLDLDLDPYRYQVVTGDALLAAATRVTATAPGVEHRTATVTGVVDGPERVRLQLDGTLVTADWLLDSIDAVPAPPLRDPSAAPAPTRLAFRGWQVSTERPVLDPALPTLMDFRVPSGGGVSFAYVLPTGPSDAFVELTAFVPPGSAGHDEDDLRAYVSGALGTSLVAAVPAEQGDLPLGPPPPRRRGHRVLAVGRRAGLLRPSSGYAYERIRRDAEAVVSSLERYGHPFVLPTRPRRHAWLDDVLLHLVHTRPQALEPAFSALFAGNPPPRVLRFLDEDTAPGEELALVRSLPAAPFLRAAADLERRRVAAALSRRRPARR